MGKHKHSKVKGFLQILHEAEIYAIPKTWDEWTSIVWQKYVKKQTFQNYGFKNISHEAEIYTIPKPRDE